MFTTADKAIVAIIMGFCFLLQSWFHLSIPNFVTADNITQALAILTPIVVYFAKNKPTQEQKVQVLSSAGVPGAAQVAKSI